MKPLSLNGMDGVGKSQQIYLLSQYGEVFHITKPLIQYSKRWPKLKNSDMSCWWFEKVPIEELVDIIIESLNARNKDKMNDKIQVFDRGCRMFQAVCAATWTTREGICIEDAIFLTNQRFRKALDHNIEECEILLVPDDDYLYSIDHYRGLFRSEEDYYEPYMNERYIFYQKNLRRAIELYFSRVSVHRVFINSSIIDIQNILRKLLNKIYTINLVLMVNSISRIIGFGGLSECGKSSFADYLRNQGFYRLKLIYFIEIIEARGEDVTPEKVAYELLHFCQIHYYVTEYTVESLHDQYIPAFLKLLLGSRMQIVYLDTDEEIRISRAKTELGVEEEKARLEVYIKDQVKISRGALKVRDIADLVFSNSSCSLVENLEKFSKNFNI